jgi:hypothetical protein
MHWQRWRKRGTTESPYPSLEERFWSKVDRRGPDECWPWLGGLFQGTGYGAFWVKTINFGAHRIAYELLVGPIPEGAQLDHLCHNRDSTCLGGPDCPHRRCVNPAHLEPTTSAINLMRGDTRAAANASKTHCPAGHPYDDANTYEHGGHRTCRECSRQSWRERHPPTGAKMGRPFAEFCRRGHRLKGENLYVSPKGRRNCRACMAIRASQREGPRRAPPISTGDTSDT